VSCILKKVLNIIKPWSEFSGCKLVNYILLLSPIHYHIHHKMLKTQFPLIPT
jgi:hypothetical protein